MNERGHSLPELLTAIAIVLIAASAAIPHLKAYSVEAHLLAAGQKFKGEFRKARSIAVRANAQTAIRFESGPAGPSYSVYMDGNRNGVLSADIASGKDRRIAGPLPLNGGDPDVRVGINPGVPAIPPDSGTLDPADPIRFGPSNMLSFSPLGTSTPGTFYLAGDGQQAAVRVTGMTARVRLMTCRGRRWVER
jgi:prepilin-type N-terminal cleavage/methylation domain-containing protein